MSSVLLTGTSRGLGLSLVKTLAARPAEEVSLIFATARSNSVALAGLCEQHQGRVVFVSLETHRQDSIDAAVTEVAKALGPDKGLDILINNA